MIPEAVLPDFQDFLLSQKLAPEKNVPYLANWVSKFLAFNNSKGQADIGQTVAEFLNSLEAKENIEDWQVRQAGEALRLYLNHFKGSEELKTLSGKERLAGRLSDSRKLLAEMKKLIRLKHFAYNTELAYLDWAERFFAYMREITKGDPDADLTPEAVQKFLSHLAITKRVAASTQNQAFNALLFLFRDVLGIGLSDLGKTVRTKRGPKLPVVLSIEEVQNIFKHMQGLYLLMAKLLYGSGLRLMELARLRVQDIDFDSNIIVVRSGKGDKDRTTVLPHSTKDDLKKGGFHENYFRI